MHNPLDETHRASCLRENLTSSSYGEGLETDRTTSQVPRQSLTRQLKYDGFRSLVVIQNGRTQLISRNIPSTRFQNFPSHSRHTLREKRCWTARLSA
jgi:protein-disulfide isomerase-like protein with CxxC motif